MQNAAIRDLKHSPFSISSGALWANVVNERVVLLAHRVSVRTPTHIANQATGGPSVFLATALGAGLRPRRPLDWPSQLAHYDLCENSFRSQDRLWFPMSSFPPRRGAYGFDAPYAPILMALGGACLLALSAWGLWSGEMNSTRHAISNIASGAAGLWLLLNTGVFVHTTRAGKFAVWAELLDRLDLKGDERLLDIGCGRGAVLLMAAQRLPRGRAVGVDIWSTMDQSGNAEQVTRQNADLEGVAERVELHTADMRRLPFDNGSFDVVVSSLAIHNISGAGERAKALREAARVLKKGGKLAIADIRHTRAYAGELETCGLKITERRSLGVRFWYAAGPWAATRLVAAIKP
jgi:arsenite methyltransferase